MSYQDTPDDYNGNGDGGDYSFARTVTSNENSKLDKEKRTAARERKRQLEDQIRTSMKTLKNPSGEKNTRLTESYHSSYQSGGESTYSGDTMRSPNAPIDTPSSFHHYPSSRNHVTNSPLPSSHQTHSGIMFSLLQCIGDAVRLGASDIVEQQPSALYESIRGSLTWIPSTMRTATTTTTTTNLLTPSSYSSSYDHSQGSYQNVETPGYYQTRG
jgi:hypothetical protein